MKISLFAVEGIAGSGKSLFSDLLCQKISGSDLLCELSNLETFKDFGSSMNRLILGNVCHKIPTHIIQAFHVYSMVDRELSTNVRLSSHFVFIQRYVASLYASMRCSGIDTDALSIFDKYPASLTFYCECDPSAAFDTINDYRVVSYWDTGKFKNKVSPEELKMDLIDYMRGVYSLDDIKESFITYQTALNDNLLTYLNDKRCVVLPKELSMSQKIDCAFESIAKINS